MKEKTSDILFRLRTGLNLSQQAVADGVKISRVAYTRYENGTRCPSAAIALRLADFFHIGVEDIITGCAVQDDEKDTENNRPTVAPVSCSDFVLSSDERKLLEDYRSLNEQGKEYIRQTMFMAVPIYIKHNNVPGMGNERIG